MSLVQNQSPNWKKLTEQEPYVSFAESYYMSPLLLLDTGEEHIIGYFCVDDHSYWIENEEGEPVAYNLEQWAEIPITENNQ